MCCGADEAKSESSTSAPPWLLDTYKRLLSRAETLTNQPYKAYTGQRVANFTPDQLAAFQKVRDDQGVADPYIASAYNAAQQGAAPVTWQQVEAAYNPTIDAQVGRLQDDFAHQNAREASATNSNAAKIGALTGSRSQIANILTQESQRRQQNPILANIRSQAYDRAWQGAEGNRDAARTGAQVFSQLGAQAQDAAGEDAQRLLAVGGAQQQNRQANLDWRYQQFQDKQQFPYQQIQWGTGIAGVGPSFAMNSTQTQQQPDSTFGNILGAGATVLGGWLSDERVKENIVEIGRTHDGQIIYRYNYKGDPTTQIGLIAQEVEQTHPEAVGEIDGVKTVNYDLATRDSAPHAEEGSEFATGGAVGLGGEPHDLPHMMANLGHAVKAMRGHMQGGRVGYESGGLVVPMGLPSEVKTGGYVPQIELRASAPASATHSSMGGGQNTNSGNWDAVNKAGGQFGKWLGSGSDKGLHSWSAGTTVIPAMNIGGVPSLGDEDQPLMYVPTLREGSAFADPRTLGGADLTSVPGTTLDRGAAPQRAQTEIKSYNATPMASMGEAYVLPAPAEPPPATLGDSGSAPASEGLAWYEPHDGKGYFEFASNPDLGVALATAGAAMMGNKGTLAQKLGRGVGTGVGTYLSQANLAREEGRKDREAELRAAEIERLTNVAKRQQDKLDFEMEEAKKGKVYTTPQGLVRVPLEGAAEKLLDFDTSRTDDIKEYEYAKGNGYRGSFSDFMRERHTRATETTLTREEAKKAVATVDRYRQAAESARGNLADVQQMRALREGVDYEGGWFPETRTTLGRNVGGLLGWLPGIPTPDEAANAEAIGSKATEMQLNFTNDTKGAISDAEMRLFGQATPGMAMSDAGAEKILSGMEAGYLRAIERSKFYDAYLKANKSISGAEEAWDTYIEANPILSLDPKTGELKVDKERVSNWRPYIGAQEYVAGDVVDGWRFKGGDAADRANWEQVAP